METKEKYKSKHKQWREKNSEKIKLKKKEWREKNSEREKEKNIEWRKNNKETQKEYKKEYRRKNKEKINEYQNLYSKNRKNNDPLFKLSCNLRVLINVYLSNKGYKKQSKTEQILGCSFNEFKLYLESKFESWMTWENHGKYNGELNFGWDIDHIVPCSSAKSEEELLKLNHFSNLQPLCSKTNRDIKNNQTKCQR
jgi:hypothetical protein